MKAGFGKELLALRSAAVDEDVGRTRRGRRAGKYLSGRVNKGTRRCVAGAFWDGEAVAPSKFFGV